jgi:NitT/TauT family transport system substrate-binding protein
MIEWGIVDSGDALELGIGAMTEEVVAGFYEDMVAGVSRTASTGRRRSTPPS